MDCGVGQTALLLCMPAPQRRHFPSRPGAKILRGRAGGVCLFLRVGSGGFLESLTRGSSQSCGVSNIATPAAVRKQERSGAEGSRRRNRAHGAPPCWFGSFRGARWLYTSFFWAQSLCFLSRVVRAASALSRAWRMSEETARREIGACVCECACDGLGSNLHPFSLSDAC